MSKTEEMQWETVNVTAIPPGIDVVMKAEGGEIVLPAIAILHQTKFGEESVDERIVLGVLDMGNGQLMAASPDDVVAVVSEWFDGEDQEDSQESALDWHVGDEGG